MEPLSPPPHPHREKTELTKRIEGFSSQREKMKLEYERMVRS